MRNTGNILCAAMSEACVPETMHDHLAVNMDHYILVFGGGLLKGQEYIPLYHKFKPLNVIWMYNLYTEQWRKHTIPHTQTVPTGRCYACAVVIHSDVYMFGGSTPTGSRCITNALWKLAVGSAGLFVWNKIVMTNDETTPSPRHFHTGWEHAEKMWIFGGYGSSPDGFLHEHGDFVQCRNNQLLCFNPSNEEWTNPQYYGRVPEPRKGHATTKCQDKVWLYGGFDYTGKAFHDLHELNMHSYTWTIIETQQMQPRAYAFCTMSMMSENKLVLHGGKDNDWKRLSDTWILDLETETWKQYSSDTPRASHTGSQGINNSVIIIGGFLGNSNMDPHQSMYKNIFHVLIEPKSLQQLAMQKICKHHTVLPWKRLPRKLTMLLDIHWDQEQQMLVKSDTQETADVGEV